MGNIEEFKDLTPIGIHRIGANKIGNDDDVLIETKAVLGRSLNTGRGVAFIGSGVTLNYGYPSWSQLIATIAEYVLLLEASGKLLQANKSKVSLKLICQFLLQHHGDEEIKLGANLPKNVSNY